MIKRVTLLLLTLSLLLTAQAKELPQIQVWNYYLTPPFLYEDGSGVADELVTELNRHFHDQFLFKLEHLPRTRLNKILDGTRQGIVLFVNWRWMGKDSKKNYLWTPSLLTDQNELISRIEDSFEYSDLIQLQDKTFLAISGRQYPIFASLIKQKNLIRFDLTREKQALALLVKGRGDLTTQPRSFALALIKQMGVEDQLYISPTPLFSYTRHLMLTPHLHQLFTPLSDFVTGLSNNPQWQQTIQKYQLSVK